MPEHTPDKIECLNEEKAQLAEEVRSCDHCSTSYAEHHRCYREAARTSGQRSRECLSD
jgi:hypothetical protein